MRLFHLIWAGPVSMMLLATKPVSGQPYPNKPVRVLTAEVGGSTDIAARLIASHLSSAVRQPVVVENRSTRILAEFAAKASNDGYSLLITSGSLWLIPFLQDKVAYDPVKSFSPVSLLTRAPNVLVVHPTLAVTSVKDLIALAKSKPGQLNYGMGPPGSSPHLAGELFKAMAGVNIVGVPYKGMAPALTDLLGGQLQLIFATASAASPHVKSGKLRALAVTSAAPSALAPGSPTMAASGLPGYLAESIYGAWTPAGVAAQILRYLNQNIVKVLNSTEVKEKFFNVGTETVGSSPDDFAATIKSEMARMGKVIRDAGIRAD